MDTDDDSGVTDAVIDLQSALRHLAAEQQKTLDSILYELNAINHKLEVVDRLAIPPMFLKRIK